MASQQCSSGHANGSGEVNSLSAYQPFQQRHTSCNVNVIPSLAHLHPMFATVSGGAFARR